MAQSTSIRTVRAALVSEDAEVTAQFAACWTPDGTAHMRCDETWSDRPRQAIWTQLGPNRPVGPSCRITVFLGALVARLAHPPL